MALNEVKLIELPKVVDFRGNLSVIEEMTQIPFEIKRVYWIYDVPGGEKRYGHAFKEQHEFIVALSGSFDIILNDGNEERVYTLNRSYNGVYVPNKIWRRIENFSTNAVALVLSSTHFSASDYIEDYNEYLQYIKDNE
ncbi:MAG: WxcM-like domain-containing protein [Bacteroidales bacterium]|nr:WxcM-like domain-containing protein [Bacteroidales bacterium]